jgi:ABC-type sugar transport system ATPase subunit
LVRALEAINAPEVLLGIRPEHITLSRESVGEASAKGVVDLTELLGSEQLVQVAVDGRQLAVTRVDPFIRLDPKREVSLTFQPDHLQFFDPVSKVSLTANVVRRQPKVAA